MEKPKITIEQLRNYLGTGLLCLLDYGQDSYFDKLVGIHECGDLLFELDEGDTHTIDEIKPQCYQIADINAFIPKLGFVPKEVLDNSCRTLFYPAEKLFEPHGLISAPFQLILQLIEWNFWVYDQKYFEEGLVIDKKTFEKEATNG